MLDLQRLGPASLVLVRHGESIGNLADRAAREAGAARLDLVDRDADVPLSDTGRAQAEALGRHLRDVDVTARPTAVVSSPYRRSAETASLALAAARLGTPVRHDERLRERELGVFDGLTGTGIRAEYGSEAQRREHLGKFYYRPPGGESWCDVALRVRSFLRDVGTRPATDRLWIFTHQAVITCFRYVLEGMDEAAVLELDRTVDVPNASTTTYRRGPAGVPELVEYASSARVESGGTPATHEPEHAGRGSAS
jgi:broad specificity phosphatase PhoE